ncbi:hypothetical protein VC83_08132 [Pseudogymnoascus destructans]|uniref:Uncharacterized protein n=2 Tax=Pseudogymnoascus destructans TaxID=655981 RepID=L8G264_PSED2|nr:uncharacterized protein VC83_08132 [Pseudogymnoascus destructans]ELR06051.1 hypothetical protein GMDG_07762 [Pseudogymnoascus destructans 20631-21]OAF55253.1 hypothetical protein VC83_08132 [Pseudogymnoascus destructans]
MSANNTPKNVGGQRIKGELNEQGARSRINTINRVKEAWGVSELIDIFPRNIRPTDQLGSTTITNLRAISNLCPDLSKAQAGMLRVCRNSDGSYKPFSFSQSKAFVEQLKEAKSMLSGVDNQSAKKKGATPSAATPNTPAKFDSPTPPSSPLKAKQAKKDKAQAAGQELLASIGKASVESAAEDDDEGNSIVVDTAPRQKPNKKARASLGQEKHGQTPAPTMAAAALVAVMTTEGSQSPTKAPTVPVAVMSTKESQAPGSRANPLKESKINFVGHDSDSEDSGSEDTGIPPAILDLVNGNAPPAKATDNGFGKATEKPTKSRFATTETVGRMVVPSRELVHPFNNKKKKRLEQSETSNPPTIDNKPTQVRKPFMNLMTSTAPKKIMTFEPPKQRIQKPGDMKKELGLVIHPGSGIQNADSNMGTQKLMRPQHDTVISPAEVSNAVTTMEDIQHQVQQVQQVEPTNPNTTTTRTQLPTSPKKRTASAMLRAADDPNPQVERSIRARLDQHAAPYNSSRAISDLLQFELVTKTLAQAAMESVTASSFAGVGGEDKKAEESKGKYLAFLTSFMASVRGLKRDLLEIAEREE